MMKYKRHKGIPRIFVLMLSIMLIVSMSGVLVFAEDVPESSDDQILQVEESATEEVSEDQGLVEDETVDEDQVEEVTREQDQVEDEIVNEDLIVEEPEEEIPQNDDSITVPKAKVKAVNEGAKGDGDSSPWSGSGTETDPWLITSAADLVSLREYVNAGNNAQDEFFKQTENISLSEYCGENIGDWTPIGIFDVIIFEGTFDGDGHTISRLYIGDGGDYTCLFVGNEGNGTIKNLTVDGYVKSATNVGGITGYNYGSITNCHFHGTVIATQGLVGCISGITNGSIINCTAEGFVTSGDTRAGGIAGRCLDTSTIENCSFSGTVTSSAEKAGGIAGAAKLGSSIIGCSVEGDINGSSYFIGGIVGLTNGTVKSCHFKGTVTGSTGILTGSTYVGGIVGCGNSSSIIDCIAEGSISGNEAVGGIAGENAGTLTNCKNYCTVTGRDSIGGIAGICAGAITSSENHGNVTVKNGYAGGITAHTYNNGSTSGYVENCKNFGTVDVGTGGYAGGIVAQADTGYIRGCENRSDVTGYEYVGGIAAKSNVEISGCVNYGTIYMNTTVTGGRYFGGIAGLTSEGSLSDCHNHGKVTGYSYVGGVAGLNHVEFTDCTNDGRVTGTKNCGIIFGYNTYNVTLTVTVQPNGAEGEEMTLTPVPAIMPECPYTHPDYDFFGWNTAADGSGTWYKPGQDMGNEVIELTLYAIWMNSQEISVSDSQTETAVILRDGVNSVPDGWYVVNDWTSLTGRLEIKGDVNLFLPESATLNALGGIGVPSGSSLTIWGQGTLIAQGGDHCAGIGGGQNQNGGTVIINGGEVTAIGSNGGAGIGGGYSGSGGTVTINEGTVNAYGSESSNGYAAAGIGAGSPNVSQDLSGGSVTINGGIVMASAGNDDTDVGANAIGANLKSSKPGSLTIADGMRVSDPLTGAAVYRDDRVSACRGSEVLVSVCEEHLYNNICCHYCHIIMSLGDIFTGNGVGDTPCLIQSEEDWNTLAAIFNEGRLYTRYNFKLTKDITVSTMIGEDFCPFQGNFDGDGHTITLNIDSDADYAAPFRCVQWATISNLRVEGSITTSADYAGGLVGYAKKSCDITNCVSAVDITATGSGGFGMAGFVGCGSGDTVTVTGSAFTGRISGANAMACTGLLGRNGSAADNCVYGGTMDILEDGVDFLRTGNNVNNCYYMNSNGLERVKGKKSVAVRGEGFDIDFGTPTAVYNVSGITVYDTGLIYDGVFYAAKDDQIALKLPELPWDKQYYVASAGELTGSGTSYTLVMPDEDVVISKEGEPTEKEKAQDNLNKAVDDAKKIEQGSYTDDSYKALQDAIKAAEALAEDPNATAEQLKAAADKVAAAKAALKKKGSEVKVGTTAVDPSGNTVQVTSVEGRTVAFIKAKNKKNVTVPPTVMINGVTYNVTQINAKAFTGSKIRTIIIGKNVNVIKKNAFKGSKATKLILKTKLLKKAKVKGCLKGSKIKTIKVKVGSKSQNKKFVKSYKKIFTKANAGKKASVK